jgi:L-2-amino-thiazoline-4-carboxylic acid hydrolase
MADELPVLTKRKLQAEVIGPIYAEMVAEVGVEKASAILDRAVRKAAIAEGKAFADKLPNATPDMQSFVELFRLWTTNGALEIDVLRSDAEHFDFDVTRCKYAETYHEMGLGKIGHLMSCNRDGSFCEGYDQKLKLERKQTIMAGAKTCTFRYTRT